MMNFLTFPDFLVPKIENTPTNLGVQIRKNVLQI